MDGVLDDLDFAAQVRGEMKDWDTQYNEWASEATDAYNMVAGRQWSEEDLARLEETGRPAVTMNQIAAMIRAVCGMEVSQRMEPRYLAREMGDVQSADMQNAAAKWVRENCDAEDEESEAFRDMLTCGMGWTETRVDFDEDPDGKILIERVDPLEMRWDPMASKKNLSDSRWRARVRKMHIDKVKEQWPDKADELTVAQEETAEDIISRINSPTNDYSTGSLRQKLKDEVSLIQYQYCRKVTVLTVLTATGQTLDVPQDKLAGRDMSVTVLSKKRVKQYRQAILCGPVVLEDEVLRCNGFTLQCMTGLRDRGANTWYGLVRDMIDPAKWSNKFFSLIIDTLSTNAKGGVMVETSAVLDPRKFEEEWADPKRVAWLKTGGTGKVNPRPAPQIPAAMNQVMEFAAASLPRISGINLEFMGMADRNQPGVLEYHRKQAVANSLAEFFASKRQYSKNQGKVLLDLIYEYISDGRLIRVTGKEGEAYLPFFKAAKTEYDVVVDEAATAPDRKMQAWLALEQLIPVALKAGMPIPPEVLDYSPLPQPLVQTWKQMLSQQPKLPEAVQQQMAEMQKQLQQLQQENAALKDKKAEAQAELQLVSAKTQTDMALKQQELNFKMTLEKQQFDHEQRIEVMRQEMERQRVEHEQRMEEWKIQRELELEEFKLRQAQILSERKLVLDASVAEQQSAMKEKKAGLQFEKHEGRVRFVTDAQGRRYEVTRDASGRLAGLVPVDQVQ